MVIEYVDWNVTSYIKYNDVFSKLYVMLKKSYTKPEHSLRGHTKMLTYLVYNYMAYSTPMDERLAVSGLCVESIMW